MSEELARLGSLGWAAPQQSEDGVRHASRTDKDTLSYPDEGLDLLGLEGGVGYWFDHRARAVAHVLRDFGVSTMWEVGSGTGAMAKRLTPPLREVVTVEPMVNGARAAAALGLEALCGTLQELDLPSDSIECLGAFDVIEHIPEVFDFLNEVRRVLQPGGIAVITVPAFSFLWGEEDDVAGHQRRYTKKTLQQQLASCGFTTVRTEYLYASLVAPAALARALPYKLGRRRTKAQVLSAMQSQLRVSPRIDRLARSVLSLEMALARRVQLPAGLSLLTAAQT